VETPVMDALVKLGLVVTGLNDGSTGRGVRELGLAGLSPEAILRYVTTGAVETADGRR
jgi:hypothetical protein